MNRYSHIVFLVLLVALFTALLPGCENDTSPTTPRDTTPTKPDTTLLPPDTIFESAYEQQPAAVVIYDDPAIIGDGSFGIGSLQRNYGQPIAEAALNTFATKHNIAVRFKQFAPDQADEFARTPLIVCGENELRDAAALAALKKYLAGGKGVVFVYYARDCKNSAAQLGVPAISEIAADDPLANGLRVPEGMRPSGIWVGKINGVTRLIMQNNFLYAAEGPTPPNTRRRYQSLQGNDYGAFCANLLDHALQNGGMVRKLDGAPLLMTGSVQNGIIDLKAKATSMTGERDATLNVQIFDILNRPVASNEKVVRFRGSPVETTISHDTGKPIENTYAYRVNIRYSTPNFTLARETTLADIIGVMNVRVLGDTEVYENSLSTVRVMALNNRDNSPMPGAAVVANLYDGESLLCSYETRTDANGTINAPFRIEKPKSDNLRLEILVTSPLGHQKIMKELAVKRAFRIFLTTDKPLYQPGQIIHIRSLSLQHPSRLPAAGKSAIIEVEDPKGNKMFKREIEIEKFGVAAADFQLADEINMGVYTVRVSLGDAERQEKKVTVSRYVKPKFNVKIESERSFYMPGETVKGGIQANYFFMDKPVADGKISVEFVTVEVEEKVMGVVEGTTDAAGHFAFEYKLQDYFVGHPLTHGNAPVFVRVKLRDTAEQLVEKSRTLTVSQNPIDIYAIPESGNLVHGVENIVYLMAAYPDGSPAGKATFTIDGKDFRADEMGIASIKVLPEDACLSLEIAVKDAQGAANSKKFDFDLDAQNEQVLLRLDKVFARVGETLHMTAFSSLSGGSMYFDIVRDGQIVLTSVADIKSGKATVPVDLSPDYAGTLIVNAYQINRSGQIVRDTKSLCVTPANELDIAIKADRDVYKPGEDATLTFTVKDADGSPAMAALGVAIVDEAIFALSEMQPGLEKIFFTLEKEIMTPRYEIHGFQPEGFIIQPLGADNPAREQAAKVLAASISNEVSYSLDVMTKDEQFDQYYAQIEKMVKYQTSVVSAAIAAYVKTKSLTSLRDIESPRALLDILVREGSLTEDQALDPWGREYIFPNTHNSRQIAYFSLGPDGKRGTNDDVFVLDKDVMPNDKVFYFKKYDIDAWQLQREMDRNDWGGGAQFGLDMANGAPGGIMRRNAMKGMEGAMPPMPADAEAMDSVTSGAADDTGSGAAKPRLREWFPETLYFNPQILTDRYGRATITIPMADEITTWRMTTMANDAGGALGSVDTPIRVFMDFFIDLDLPVAMTQSDYFKVPVVVHNYLKTRQTITLTLETGEDEWFDLTGDAVQKIEVDPGRAAVAYFGVKAVKVGKHAFTVLARSDNGTGDYIKKGVDVAPDGQMHEIAFNGKLDGTFAQTIAIPQDAIDGSYKIIVQLYPGVFSQLQDGMDKIFQMPYGCFEQTSSATHPNVLALDYMKRTKKDNPELRLKAEEYINLGYQRLVSFEVGKGAGFSVFGQAPANRVLTAYGLMEFHDMSRVSHVDPDVIGRTQTWLAGQQKPDGSWEADAQYCHSEMWGAIQKSSLLPTAYVTWGLAYSGYKGPEIAKGVDYIVSNIGAENDPYTLAIVLNALAIEGKHKRALQDVVDKIVALQKTEGDKAWWETGSGTISYSRGDTASLEATALIVAGLMVADMQHNLVSKALNYIIDKKQPSGNWTGTQATILCLRALLMSAEKQTEKVNGEITLTMGSASHSYTIDKTNSDVMRIFDLGNATQLGDNKITLSFKGEGATMFQIVGRYWQPWGVEPMPQNEPMHIDVAYDRTTLKVDDMVTAKVKVTCDRPGTYDMVMIDLGIAPGFEVQTGDLQALVEKGLITRYETTGRQVILYVEKLDGSKGMEFSFRMRAKFVLKAKTPQSRVYKYYNPDQKGESRPVEMEVR